MRLEEFVTSELESTLEEVSSKGRTNTGPNSSETFLSNDLPEAANETTVILDGVELYSSLDAISPKLALRILPSSHMIRTGKAYTSTGVKEPWVTEQQTAPAKAKRE